MRWALGPTSPLLLAGGLVGCLAQGGWTWRAGGGFSCPLVPWRVVVGWGAPPGRSRCPWPLAPRRQAPGAPLPRLHLFAGGSSLTPPFHFCEPLGPAPASDSHGWLASTLLPPTPTLGSQVPGAALGREGVADPAVRPGFCGPQW